jgi:hypothetical protein
MELLRSVQWGESAVALHSLNLAEMEYKRWGEIDFVLVGRPGILVIEVTGGDVSCHGGIWRYEDGRGRVVKRHESPLAQCKDAYFSLMEKYLKMRFGHVFDDIVTGFCVILAGAPRKLLQPLLGGPDFPTRLVGSQRDVSDKGQFQAFLSSSLSHWRDLGGRRRGYLTDERVKQIVSYLRPEFERIQPLSLTLRTVRDEQVELTQDQYNCLDHWEGAERILVSGPAGCGKTFVAAEMARRAATNGSHIAFVTGTDALARELARESIPQGITLASYSTLSALERDAPFDMVIIDEGQLLLGASQLALLDRVLDGGLAAGCWAWFGDPTFQGDRSAESTRCLTQLRSLASVTPRLEQNCRNTPQVVAAVELCSGAPIGHARVKGSGPPVEYLEAPIPEAAPRAAALHLKGWLDEGVGLSEMVLLLAAGDVERFATEVGQTLSLPVLPWHQLRQHPMRALAWSTVEEFRGLEAPFVLLSSLESELADMELQRLLYAGMSRANLALAVAASHGTMERLRAFNTAAMRTAKSGIHGE